jgi:hypothetical protein
VRKRAVEVVNGAVDVEVRERGEVAKVAHVAADRMQVDAPQVGEVGDVVQTWPEGVAEAQVREARCHRALPDGLKEQVRHLVPKTQTCK